MKNKFNLKHIVGEQLLNRVQNSYLAYVESSAAVYEVSGDYAAAIFSSRYCDYLNKASRKKAGKTDDEALKSGKWICHEDCWAASLKSIKEKKPCEMECSGGINIYAMPIIADGMVIGSNNVGLSNPPIDEKKIGEIAQKYKVDPKELLRIAKEYSPRPEHIMNAAKNHVSVAADTIAEFFLRIKAEEEREILFHEMGERVKELRCLYDIAESIRKHKTVEAIFRDVVVFMPSGWQYPDITRGKIRFEGQDYVTEPFEETEWRQTSDIRIKGKRSGSVEVYYLEERPKLDEGPFLSEERNLIDGIANTLSEAIERKQAEEELLESERTLKIHAKELEESNIALKVLLTQREQDKTELEENILSNVKHLILPYILKLKRNKAMLEDLAYLNILESNLKEIISPFSVKLSSKYLGLTPKEIQIANLIKDGKQDKDIMEILNISQTTVKSHRQNIRKKLGIYSKRANLKTHLLSITG